VKALEYREPDDMVLHKKREAARRFSAAGKEAAVLLEAI
jgi:hypothetical protein